jgi:putative addiction module killer protein
MNNDIIPKLVRIYITKEGKKPFLEWLQRLRDRRAKQKVQLRIDRLRLGNLGHAKSVGDGVQELKIDYGPGYRLYVGLEGKQIIILLLGGDKSSQHEDIKKAKKYWTDFKEQKKSFD